MHGRAPLRRPNEVARCLTDNEMGGDECTCTSRRQDARLPEDQAVGVSDEQRYAWPIGMHLLGSALTFPQLPTLGRTYVYSWTVRG